MMNFAPDLIQGGPRSATAIVTTTFLTTISLILLIRYTLYPARKARIPGPLTTLLPRLTAEQRKALPYHPEHYPGGRTVETPYGAIRVYEFGPEEGRKVLFLHGISTSCITVTDMAQALALAGDDRGGCRVMLFDLFGRGYTDGVGDVPHDTRLYVTQILLVLASSPLAWTGRDAMHVIGYSLGGAIAVNFAATFPHMVASLVLLAPAGLIRRENIGTASRLVFTSGLVPEAPLEAVTRRRLRRPIAGAVAKKRQVSDKAPRTVGQKHAADGGEDVIDVAVQEVVDDKDTISAPHALEVKVGQVVHWMLDHHAGFVPAFMSTIRYAPLFGQHEYWRKLALRQPGTTAVILGRDDVLIQKDDYAEDALPLMGGRDHVFWRVVPGAHNFPFTHSKEALEAVYEFWRM